LNDTLAQLSKLKVVVVSHITDLAGPTEALEDFLKVKVRQLGLIYHPFYYCADRRSQGRLFSQGSKIYNSRLPGIKLPEVFQFAEDIILTIYYLFRFARRFDIFVGVNPLNAAIGILLRKLGLVRTVVLYTIDWMPRRFPIRLMNNFYHAVDRFAVRHCDVAWSLTPRIAAIREEQGLPQEKSLVVPVGVQLKKIRRIPIEQILRSHRKRAVLLGALAPSKGADLVIKAFSEIARLVPNVELLIIGRTPINASEDSKAFQPYEDKLVQLGERVRLLGVLPHDEVLRVLPQCHVGLAPYDPSGIILSQYADPSRVKDYLACGLPVVITKVPQIAGEIERLIAGIVIEYDATEFVNAVVTLLTDDELYRQMRNGAIKLAQEYDWETIFIQALSRTLLISDNPTHLQGIT